MAEATSVHSCYKHQVESWDDNIVFAGCAGRSSTHGERNISGRLMPWSEFCVSKRSNQLIPDKQHVECCSATGISHVGHQLRWCGHWKLTGDCYGACCRGNQLSGACKDAPSTGSAPAHGPQRAATPPVSQHEPSHHHHQHSMKPESGSADKDGAVQSGIHQEADTGNSPMQC